MLRQLGSSATLASAASDFRIWCFLLSLSFFPNLEPLGILLCFFLCRGWGMDLKLRLTQSHE